MLFSLRPIRSAALKACCIDVQWSLVIAWLTAEWIAII